MASLTLLFLGSPSIELNGQIIELDTRKALALLAYLAVSGGVYRRDALATLFWPESDQKRAKGSLRYTLSSLKKTLGPNYLTVTRNTVEVSEAADIRLDVTEFRNLTHLGLNQPSTSQLNQSKTKPPLQEAIDLYRGDFLTGFSLPDCPAFDEWQFFEAETLRQTFSEALQSLIVDYEAKQMYEPAMPLARRWIALDPLHEPAHHRLMQLYAQADRPTEALRQYKTCKQIFLDELGIQPGAVITALAEQLQTKTFDTVVTRPTAIPVSEPPKPPVYNLPQVSTSFVNRTRELQDITAQLAQSECRLLTLIGPGGIGKTRLALKATEALHEQASLFNDGVYYADLTPVRLVKFLAMTIAGALDLSFQGEQAPEEQLINYLQSKRTLLLLDNFEHLLDGVSIITDLLSQTTHVKMIVTSRIALDLPEEWLFPVPGLVVPDKLYSGDQTEYDSVQLFAQRARQVSPQFSLKKERATVFEICWLVNGLPLGIELAAAWVRTLSLSQIAQEITKNLDFLSTLKRTPSERHRSLRAVFEYSWGLLTQTEQQVLAQLSVFRGGFTAEALLAVTGATFFDLHRLVNQSLVQRLGDNRYTIHELLRQFAAEKLDESSISKEDVQNRHADYYGQFLQQQEPLFDSDQEMQAIAQLKMDIQNIRAGWHWSASQQNKATLFRYIDCLHTFYEIVAWYQEGREVFDFAISHLTDTSQLPSIVELENDFIFGKLMVRQAEFCYDIGQTELALQLVDQGMVILNHHQDQSELALAYKVMGGIKYLQGLYPEAKALLLQSIEIAPKNTAIGKIANRHLFLGAVAYSLGDYAEAKQWQQSSLAMYQDIKKLWGVGHALRWLGMTSEVIGEYQAAETYYQDSMTIFETINNPIGISLCSNNLGYLLYKQQNYLLATTYYQQSLMIHQEYNNQIGTVRALNYLSQVYTMRDDYDKAKSYLKDALEMSLNIKSTPFILHSLLSLTTFLIEEQTLLDQIDLVSEPNHIDHKLKQIFDLLTIVINHPASQQEIRDQAEVQLTEIVSRLPSSVVHVLQQGVRYQDVEAMIAALIPPNNQALHLLKGVNIDKKR